MINLSPEQKDFISKEFEINLDADISKEVWKSINEKCYDIVLDEMLDENDEYNEKSDGNERCSLASSLMDIKYKDLVS